MAEHRSSIDIEAAPEVVFNYLVTDAGITAWLGEWSELEPRPGGRFAVDVAGYAARGMFLEVDPPRRVLMSWGFAGSETLPPGTSTVSFQLTSTTYGTRVELVHTDLPDDQVPGHVEGWAQFLPRLAGVAAGGQPSPSEWRPTASTATPLPERGDP